jgi:hypothetical protein
MKNKVTKSLAVAAVLCTVLTAARADVRIKMRDAAGRGSEVTLYLKGSLQRRDLKTSSPDGRTYNWTMINDCAREQFTWIDYANRRYWMMSGGVPAAVIAAFNEQQFAPFSSPKSKGTVTETIAVTDTGERREVFGFTARRLKTLTTWSVAPDACDTGQTRIETDGWYIDLMYGVDCSPDLSGATPRMLVEFVGNKCLNKRLWSKHFFRRRYVGEARLGFPLSETMRNYDKRGRLASERTQEVLEISTDKLDDALFVVPDGYTLTEPEHGRKQSLLSRALSLFR